MAKDVKNQPLPSSLSSGTSSKLTTKDARIQPPPSPPPPIKELKKKIEKVNVKRAVNKQKSAGK